MPRPPAFETAAASRGLVRAPIGAWMIGWSIPSRRVKAVSTADMLRPGRPHSTHRGRALLVVPGADLCSQPVGRGVVAGRQTVEPEQRGAEHRRRVEHADLGGRRDGPDELDRRAARAGRPRHGRARPRASTGTGSSSRLSAPDRRRRERRELVGDVVDPGRAPPRPRRGRPGRRPAPAPPPAGPRSCRGTAPRSRRPGFRARSGRARASRGWSPDRGRRPPGRPRPGPTSRARIPRRDRRRSSPRPLNRATRPSGARPTAFMPDPQITATPQPSGVPARRAANVSLNSSVSPASRRARVRLREARARPTAGPSRPGSTRRARRPAASGRPCRDSRPRRGAGRRARTAGRSPGSSAHRLVGHRRPADAPRSSPPRTEHSATSVFELPPSTARTTSFTRRTARARRCGRTSPRPPGARR